MDLTRAPRGAVAFVAAGAALVVVAVGVLVVAAVRGILPGTPDCVVSLGARTVDLDTTQAQTAASVSARAVRLRRGLDADAAAVADVLHLSRADARVVAAALTGRARHALTCRHGGSTTSASRRLDGRGLTARADRVRRDLDRAFGRQRDGGFAPGGVRSGHMPGSAHYEGRAIDVFVRPISPRHKTRGWAMAQYLVAQAERLDIATVIFDGHIWTARRGGEGWRPYRPDVSNRPRAVARILEHRDHVHVDVPR